MYADVLFDSKGNPNGLTVPKSAVVTSTERKYVIVVRDGKAVKVNVDTGNANSGDIEIVGAVKPGEEVIVDANDEIKEGIQRKIRIGRHPAGGGFIIYLLYDRPCFYGYRLYGCAGGRIIWVR